MTVLTALPGESAQADCADFGAVTIGRAERRLSCFVVTLSYSRALYAEFSTRRVLTDDGARLRAIANLPEPVALRDGLRQTVEWFRAN